MGIANKVTSLISLAVLTNSRSYQAIFFNQFLNLGITDNFPTLTGYILNQSVDKKIAVALQPPATLYEWSITMNEGKERQGILPQLHL